MEEVLIPLGFFAFIIILVYMSKRHKERKMLISMGQPIDSIDTKDYFKSSSMSSLKLGLLGVGLALGIFAGNALACYTDLVEEAAYFSMIFLFGGISLLVFYFISSQKNKEQ